MCVYVLINRWFSLSGTRIFTISSFCHFVSSFNANICTVEDFSKIQRQTRAKFDRVQVSLPFSGTSSLITEEDNDKLSPYGRLFVVQFQPIFSLDARPIQPTFLRTTTWPFYLPTTTLLFLLLLLLPLLQPLLFFLHRRCVTTSLSKASSIDDDDNDGIRSNQRLPYLSTECNQLRCLHNNCSSRHVMFEMIACC